MIRFYLAGASVDVNECATSIASLQKAGLVCTYNWTKDVLKSTIPESELSAADRLRFAQADTNGVLEADIFWLRVPSRDVKSIGCWYELGVASMLKRLRPKVNLIVSGDHKQTIFTKDSNLAFETHIEAETWIVQHYGK